MRVWSPPVLVRKNAEEDASISDAAAQLFVKEGKYESHKSTQITVLTEHPESNTVFAGKYNGQVFAFSTKGGEATVSMCSQTHTALIINIAVTENSIASSDVAGNVQIWSLSLVSTKPEFLRAEIHTTDRVKQLCFSADGEYLLVATMKYDCVHRVAGGSCVGTWTFEPQERKSWRWLILPHRVSEEQYFSLIADGTIRSYSAQLFPQSTGKSNIRLQYVQHEDGTDSEETDIDTAAINMSTKTLVLGVRYQKGFVSCSTVFIFDLSMVESFLIPLSPTLPKLCKHFLGFVGTTTDLLFLDQDSWLSSISLLSLGEKRYTRHFFVPNDFLSAEVLPVKTADNDIVFCLHGELISVTKGMQFSAVAVLE